ncbi:hypothetical protein BGX38DRAFT_1154184 [Terfezia claveryi]|nr:hypothetical protein BGX38DRAFT_1154184 [Terfezia claveryi]
MNVPPQIIKVKRRRDEDPVQALVVNKKIRGSTDSGPESSSSWLSPGSTVYRLQRTEGKGGEVEAPEEGRLEIPIVRNTVAETVTAAATEPRPIATHASLSVHTPTMGSTTPTKRKGAPESPLMMVGVPGFDHTPPIPSPRQTTTTTAGVATSHRHPPGGKDNASLLQVPQPRRYHLAHRVSHKRGSTPGSPVKWGPGSPKKSAVFMEGDGSGVGCPVSLSAGGAAGVHREKKRRRERKEELRVMLSRESLKEKAKTQAETMPVPSTRKRPNVNPLEKKQNEERKRKLLGKTEILEPIPSENGMDVDTPKVPQQTKPHPVRDNIDNGDNELSKQLQSMVLAYLNDQDGITNLPTTPPATIRQNPGQGSRRLSAVVPMGMCRSRSARSESDAGLTEDESELSESEYVYDVYVKQTVEHKKLVSAARAAVAGVAGALVDAESQLSAMKPGEYGLLVISNPDDEEWFYEGGWEDEDKSEEEGLSDDEDSNAEDYHTNDYPDEEEVDEDFLGENDNDEYNIDDDDEIERNLYSGLMGHRGNMVQSDGEGDSESESYEKVYGRGSQKRDGWDLGGRRKFAPGEEEYDLAEASGSEDSDVEMVRRKLERGVWGIGSRSSVMEGDSDEDMD